MLKDLKNRFKGIKKRYIALLIAAIAPFILFLSLFILIQLPPIQNFFINKATLYFSDLLQTEVTIDRVRFVFFNSYGFKGLLVKDLQNDTLAYSKEIKVNIYFSEMLKGNFKIKSVFLTNPDFRLKYAADSISNIDFIINHFANNSAQSVSTVFKLQLENLTIENGKFTYHDYYAEKVNFRINYSDIKVENLSLEASDISIVNDSISALAKNLSLKEKSGFEINHLEGLIVIDDEELNVKNLLLQTPLSDLNLDLRFQYTNWESYTNFIEDVLMTAKFNQSLLNFKDISYFAEDLNGLNHEINLSGEVKGTVCNLRSKNFDIAFGQSSHLMGNFKLIGLPDVNNTMMNFDFTELKTSKSDLDQIPITPFFENKKLQTPNNLKELGIMTFKGKISGFPNDFVAYGELNTAIGKLKSDVKIAFPENDLAKYIGSLELYDFNLGQYINEKSIGVITLKADVDGKGLEKNNLDIDLTAKIELFQYANYNYRDIAVDGSIKNRFFEGRLNISDENIKMNFEGEVDLQATIPQYSFCADIERLNLYNLNLFKKDSNMLISTQLIIDCKGNNIEDIEGIIAAYDTKYNFAGKNYYINQIELLGHQISATDNELILKSDLVDAKFKGDFKFSNYGKTLEHFLNDNFAIDTTLIDREEKFNHNYSFNIKIKDLTPVKDIFFKYLSVSKNTSINGNFDYENKNFNTQIVSDIIQINSLKFINNKMNILINKRNINTIFNTESLSLSDSVGLSNLQFVVNNKNLKQGEIFHQITWQNEGKRKNEGDVNIKLTYYKSSKIEFNILPSKVFINDTAFSFSEKNRISIDSNYVLFEDLKLFSADNFIELSGAISPNVNDELHAKVKDFRLSYFNGFLKSAGVELYGNINGTLKLKKTFQNPEITVDSKIDQFIVNKELLGNVIIKSNYNIDSNAFYINSSILRDTMPVFSVRGFYFPENKFEHLALKVSLNKFRLNVLSTFTEDIVSDIRGIADGEIKVSGNITKPILKGKILLTKSSFTVDYTKTRYNLTDYLVIEPSYFGCNYVLVNDQDGNKGYLTATVLHQNYSNFNLDIFLETNRFMALNTKPADNELFYGKAYFGGTINISGYTNQLGFEINGKTLAGTTFNMPMNKSKEVTANNFVTFLNKNEVKVEKQEELDLSGINLLFDLDVTPDAKMNVIFDETVGDVMSGSGIGHLKMEITTTGKFEMFGDITITEGSYLFTLLNVINKKFAVQNGSTILWSGNPYNAKVDIKAIYKLRTTLYDLGIDTTKRRVPVEAILKMTGALFKPEIGFDIKLPDVQENVRQQFNSLISNKEELNRQMFALLAITRFVVPQNNYFTITTNTQGQHAGVGATASSEFLSNQLSNWLSQISKDFDINVNYRPGDKISAEETSLALSTQLFNDRLSIDGGVSYTRNLNAQANNEQLLGDFNIEYKITNDGRFRFKGFQRANNTNLLNVNNPYTQGVGLSYRKEFNSWNEFFKSFWNIRKDITQKDKQQKSGT